MSLPTLDRVSNKNVFLKRFAYFDRIKKLRSNGLSHTATQMTAPDEGEDDSTFTITELGAVHESASTLARATYPAAIFARGAGVSFLEEAAVASGGAPYDPSKNELASSTITLSRVIQRQIFQGNLSTSSGAGSATELGAYNPNGIDGLRSVAGSQGTFSTNNAIQIDRGSLSLTAAVRKGAAQVDSNGGVPSAVIMSSTLKQVLDDENATNQRYNNDFVEIAPGVRTNKLTCSVGDLAVVSVPGTTIGSYLYPTLNSTVEDAYVLDEDGVILRWLFNEGFTVLQIPSGVDGKLSSRWIIFYIACLELATPPFMCKVRTPASQ